MDENQAQDTRPEQPTTPPMPTMRTDQELFDKVATHLLEQNYQAYNWRGPAYRGEYGCKCAIGCLIPDANYHRSLENMPVTHPLIQFIAGIGNEQLFLARALQSIHDRSIPSTWRERLRLLANDLGLSTAVLG